jgi:hypothetical protein
VEVSRTDSMADSEVDPSEDFTVGVSTVAVFMVVSTAASVMVEGRLFWLLSLHYL